MRRVWREPHHNRLQLQRRALLASNKYGNACWYLGEPFVNNCDYDFSGHLLAEIFKNARLAWNATRGDYIDAHLHLFDQTVFGANPVENSMDTLGYVYIPQACADGAKCHLHVAFYGCLTGRDIMGTGVVKNLELTGPKPTTLCYYTHRWLRTYLFSTHWAVSTGGATQARISPTSKGRRCK